MNNRFIVWLNKRKTHINLCFLEKGAVKLKSMAFHTWKIILLSRQGSVAHRPLIVCTDRYFSDATIKITKSHSSPQNSVQRVVRGISHSDWNPLFTCKLPLFQVTGCNRTVGVRCDSTDQLAWQSLVATLIRWLTIIKADGDFSKSLN